MIRKTCINCGKPIKAVPFATHQKYCSVECQRKFYKLSKDQRKEIELSTFKPFYFECSECGQLVEVLDDKDKRTRFCCQECEKKYWKHPPYEQETSRTNFHSVQEYLSYERRTNND